MHRYGSKKTWRPRFKVGDLATVVYVPFSSGFYKDDRVQVVDRSVRERSRDPRENRYRVRTLDHFGQQVEGWLGEDDLEAR